MSSSWGERLVGAMPAWPSDITDDGTPFEFSVAFGASNPKLRMLVEAQQAPFDLHSNWQAGLELHTALQSIPHLDVSSFDRIADLFAPGHGPAGRFALWHAADISEARVTLKAYLNPQIRGPEAAPGLIHEALQRLGCGHGCDLVTELLEDPDASNELVYFSLDLSAAAGARAKVYIAHRQATAAEIESQLARCDGHVRGDALSWITALTGSKGPFSMRPILSCFAFSASTRKPSITLHIPTRCYVENDADSAARVGALLAPVDRQELQGILVGFSGRPLDVGRSLITYVSLRREAAGLQITTYLAPEAYAIAAPRPRVGRSVRRLAKLAPWSIEPPRSMTKAMDVV
jgi:DMATS type aromatic prenyltransferase